MGWLVRLWVEEQNVGSIKMTGGTVEILGIVLLEWKARGGGWQWLYIHMCRYIDRGRQKVRRMQRMAWVEAGRGASPVQVRSVQSHSYPDLVPMLDMTKQHLVAKQRRGCFVTGHDRKSPCLFWVGRRGSRLEHRATYLVPKNCDNSQREREYWSFLLTGRET